MELLTTLPVPEITLAFAVYRRYLPQVCERCHGSNWIFECVSEEPHVGKFDVFRCRNAGCNHHERVLKPEPCHV